MRLDEAIRKWWPSATGKAANLAVRAVHAISVNVSDPSVDERQRARRLAGEHLTLLTAELDKANPPTEPERQLWQPGKPSEPGRYFLVQRKQKKRARAVLVYTVWDDRSRGPQKTDVLAHYRIAEDDALIAMALSDVEVV